VTINGAGVDVGIGYSPRVGTRVAFAFKVFGTGPGEEGNGAEGHREKFQRDCRDYW
jgi:hypothetical protein